MTNVSILTPATLDLASHIGASLARDTLPAERRALYHRIWARMSPDAHRRVCEAHALACKAAR